MRVGVLHTNVAIGVGKHFIIGLPGEWRGHGVATMTMP